jgi:hypothetical protein
LPIAIFLKSFLEQAGKDVAEALRDFIKRIFKARESSGQDGQFVLIDEDSGIRLMILGDSRSRRAGSCCSLIHRSLATSTTHWSTTKKPVNGSFGSQRAAAALWGFDATGLDQPCHTRLPPIRP